MIEIWKINSEIVRSGKPISLFIIQLSVPPRGSCSFTDELGEAEESCVLMAWL